GNVMEGCLVCSESPECGHERVDSDSTAAMGSAGSGLCKHVRCSSPTPQWDYGYAAVPRGDNSRRALPPTEALVLALGRSRDCPPCACRGGCCSQRGHRYCPSGRGNFSSTGNFLTRFGGSVDKSWAQPLPVPSQQQSASREDTAVLLPGKHPI